ncbi:MAG: sodium/panthothenate symporter, partial [Spirochaetia bacterium]|nr:sodium/panthothenate symporter [Spirochaetia bacterium]
MILAILLIYLALNAVIGIWYNRKKSLESALSVEKKYYIGSRSMNGLLLAMTTMATYTSVSSFVSGPGAAGMTFGYAQVWIAAVQVPVTFFILGVLGNKMALVARRTGAVTVAGYLKARYKSDALVIVTSLLMVAFFIAQMISQFTGGATLIQSITGLNYKYSLFIFAAVVIIYTALGGFSAVAITDAIQGFIMCIGTFLFLFFVLQAGGGLSGIDAGLQQ